MTTDPHAPGAALEHHGDAHPPAEEDLVPSGRIVAVGAAALVVFLIGSVAAGLGMRAMQQRMNPDGAPPLPSEAGKGKIGIVEQRLFEHSNMGPAWRERSRRRLETFGWVDREKGIVHVPIDQAMEQVEKGKYP